VRAASRSERELQSLGVASRLVGLRAEHQPQCVDHVLASFGSGAAALAHRAGHLLHLGDVPAVLAIRVNDSSTREVGSCGLNAEQPIDVVLAYGAISFDGRVLEVFGLTGDSSARLHVATITGMEYDGKQVVVRISDQMQRTFPLPDMDENDRSQLESLIGTVRRASPNLKEGS
jgi:hypothetical protein